MRHASGEIPDEIKVPAYWRVVHQLSSGFTKIFTTSIHSFGKPTHIRDITLELDYMTLDNLPLRAELRRFDLDCHLPALRKLEKENPADVIAHTTPSGPPSQWRADDMFFEESGYYDTLTAILPIPAWTGHYDFMDGNAGPRCDVWWKDPSNGLERRIYDHIIKKTENPDHDFALVTYTEPPTVATTVRRFLLKEPPPSKFGADISGDGAKGDLLETKVGYVGDAVTYPAVKGAMYLAKNSLANVPSACSHVYLHRDPIRRIFRGPKTVIAAVFHKRHIQPQVHDRAMGVGKSARR